MIFAGKEMAFSPFERSQSKSKLSSVSMRYGFQTNFMTIAPPGHNDLPLLKLALIREKKAYNNTKVDSDDAECSVTDNSNSESENACSFKCKDLFSEDDFNWENLPSSLKDSARRRLLIAQRMSAQCVFAFSRKLDDLLNKLVKCPQSKDIRQSLTYFERETSVIGKINAIDGIIEPQKESRLHGHFRFYSTDVTPHLLKKMIAAKEMQEIASAWMNSVSTACLMKSTHQWIKGIKKEGKLVPRACELRDVSVDLSELCKEDVVQKHLQLLDHVCENTLCHTNFHKHSFTCEKGAKGNYFCRLCMARGLNPDMTRLPMITVRSKGDMTMKEKAKLDAHELDKDMMKHVDSPVNHNCSFKKPKPEGPMKWELHRPEDDKYFVETNKYFSMLDGHTNMQLFTTSDEARPAVDYEINYLTKESEKRLQAAASEMLAAMNHVQEVKSTADDAGKETRKSKFFAQRTINSFQGGSEHEMKTMIAAFLGMKSHVASEKFHYLFIRTFANFLENAHVKDDDLSISSAEENDFLHKECFNDKIDEVKELMDNDEITALESGASSESKIIKVSDGEFVFFSQVESCINRGKNFEQHSPVEFECIVEIKKCAENEDDEEKKRGRKKHKGMDLAEKHPLAKHGCKGCIRSKFCTPVFGGKPIPSCSKDDFNLFGESKEDIAKADQMENLSKFLLVAYAPWSVNCDGNVEALFEFSNIGLLHLMNEWDNSNASE